MNSLRTLRTLNGQRLYRLAFADWHRPQSSTASSSDNSQSDDHNSRKVNSNWTTFGGSIVASVLVGAYLYNKNNASGLPRVLASTAPPPQAHKTVRGDLKTYGMDEVAKHNGKTLPTIWVTYGCGVYDITDFVPKHPGNVTNIMMGAGSAIDPFWHTFQQHQTPQVLALLETFRCGNLAAADVVGTKDLHDPWENEPVRSEWLRPASKRPFNAEPPSEKLVDNFLTPADLFYVRNHLPVPDVDIADYELVIENSMDNTSKSVTLTLDQLHALKKHSVTVTVMCGGNRRSEMHAVRPVRGLHWGQSAVGNAVWSGPKLCDILREMGVESDDRSHVHFEGLDVDATAEPYAASIPLYKAMDPRGDVILAYEMNGEPLSRDHGFPVRVIVPGVVGARHVKWLSRVTVAEGECTSHWQQGDYKGFSPSTDWDTVDFSKSTPMQHMPVTSAICNIKHQQTVELQPNGTLLVKGYAWSGGGNKIVRVDLTADGGKSWQVAELEGEASEKGQLPTGRNWAWTLWSAKMPVPASDEGDQTEKEVEVWSKAVDSNYNVQPESFENTWNLRGVLSHAYCRVRVKVIPAGSIK